MEHRFLPILLLLAHLPGAVLLGLATPHASGCRPLHAARFDPGGRSRPTGGHGGGRRRQPAADRRALRQRQPRRSGAEPRRAVAHAPRARRARRADGGALHVRRRGVVHRLHALQPRGAQHLLHGGRLRPRARVQPAGRHVVRGDGGDRHVPRQLHPLRLARGPGGAREGARGDGDQLQGAPRAERRRVDGHLVLARERLVPGRLPLQQLPVARLQVVPDVWRRREPRLSRARRRARGARKGARHGGARRGAGAAQLAHRPALRRRRRGRRQRGRGRRRRPRVRDLRRRIYHRRRRGERGGGGRR